MHAVCKHVLNVVSLEICFRFVGPFRCLLLRGLLRGFTLYENRGRALDRIPKAYEVHLTLNAMAGSRSEA